MVLLILGSKLKLVGDTFGECQTEWAKNVQINLTDLE